MSQRESAGYEGDLPNLRLFDGLTTGEIGRIAQMARRRELGRGQCLFRQEEPGDRVFLVLSGQARLLRVTPDGQQVILGLAGPGQMVGIVSALGHSYPVTAECGEGCTVLVWSADVFARLMAQCPRLGVNALQVVTDQLRQLQDRYVELSTERVERRVARTLLRLARSTGRVVDGGILIDLRLSRKDLAEMTGTTLYTISRILSRWEQAHLIESGRERVLIRYPHGLVVIAEDLEPAAVPERMQAQHIP